MTLKGFALLTGGIQSIALILGAILGGIWAFFRVIQSKELERAKLETEKVKQDFYERKGVNISIDFKLGKPIGQYLPGFIFIEIEFSGRNPFEMFLGDYPMRIGSFKEFGTDKQNYQLIAKHGAFSDNFEGKTPSTRTVSQLFLPNSKRTFSFYHLFKEEGIYLLSFVHDMPESFKEQSRKLICKRSKEILDINEPLYSENLYVQVTSPDKESLKV